ncbi:4Fe-4S dicluster domain-containing protein [Proteiniclasticum ruminis]|uniref:NQRA C-terminal domain-containing protein n=1 Tax=Proteiniclasticum ruminis TaxID=398199 RepID=A0A1I4XZ94_9CLOT|nr:4Fe-4S dicluster domain-containing protein [Proteiniclasticum ruminis]SFN30723.1 NQRA C-terminal domain-containing protein [Proteiniclasticum ruminis]
MKLFSISKAVHVPKFKVAEHFSEVIEVDAPKNMVYSLSQQHNMKCSPTVKRGDRVLVNQVIGVGENNSVVPVYSSVSGTVKQITTKTDLLGNKVDVVLVENDGLYEKQEREVFSYSTLSMDELREKVKALGLIETQNLSNRKRGMQLSFKDTAKNILINAQESGLYGQVDSYLYEKEKQDFLRGIDLLKSLYKDAQIVVLSTSDADSVIGFTELLKNSGVSLISKIPTQFYHDMNLAARDVFGDFAMKDTMVIDAFLLPAVARGLMDQRLTHYQLLLINGGAVKNPGIYKVMSGTTLDLVMEKAGVENPFRIVAGNILSGDAVFTTDSPINRGIREVLFLNENEVSIDEEMNCIKCGRCADVCPMGLQPYELNQLVIVRDFDEFFKKRGGMCVECGRCSYVCPSKRHLLQSFKTAKKVKR